VIGTDTSFGSGCVASSFYHSFAADSLGRPSDFFSGSQGECGFCSNPRLNCLIILLANKKKESQPTIDAMIGNPPSS